MKRFFMVVLVLAIAALGALGIRWYHGAYVAKLVPTSFDPCDPENQPRVFRDTANSKWPIARERPPCEPPEKGADDGINRSSTDSESGG